jgi:hypothetical protein
MILEWVKIGTHAPRHTGLYPKPLHYHELAVEHSHVGSNAV